MGVSVEVILELDIRTSRDVRQDRRSGHPCQPCKKCRLAALPRRKAAAIIALATATKAA